MPGFLAEQLTKAENYEFYTALKAAQSFAGTNPCELMLRPEWKLSKDRIKVLDRKFKIAWQILQDETCSSCGMPSWYGRSESNLIEIVMEESVCEGCAEKDRQQNERRKEKSYEATPGAIDYPVARSVDKDIPLPTRRDWLRELQTRALAKMARRKANDERE